MKLNKMILYQILDENNLMMNEFRQREMAQCHLDIMNELSQNHSYHINVRDVEKDNSSPSMTTHLIKNFG